MGKKRRDKFTFYQCKKCLAWRIVFWETANRLENGDYKQQDKLATPTEMHQIIDGENLISTFNPAPVPISQKKVDFISSGVGEPASDTRRWLEKEGRKKRASREQNQRFRAAESLHARPYASDKKRQPAKRIGDVFPGKREPNLKAALKLARQTVRKLFPAFSGKFPVTARPSKRRIPIQDALCWHVSLGERSKIADLVGPAGIGEIMKRK
jgi:hypothetical protein